MAVPLDYHFLFESDLANQIYNSILLKEQLKKDLGLASLFDLVAQENNYAIDWNTGMITDGRKADGSRVMLTMLRLARPTAAALCGVRRVSIGRTA